MSPEVVLFRSEEKKDRSEVVEFCRTLADKLGQGELTLRAGSEEIHLVFPQNVVLELKVEEETKHGKLKKTFELEIEWYEGDESGTGGEVSIS